MRRDPYRFRPVGTLNVQLRVHRDARDAVREATDLLAQWIHDPAVRGLMVAGGNTPLPLYDAVAQRGPVASGLQVYVLDEYVGVPETDPRTCTNLLRARVAIPWGVAGDAFWGLSSDEETALAAVEEHERRIEAEGGLDAIVLGLGRNGHLGFNEPGGDERSQAHVSVLAPASIDANAVWFGGQYAPRQGATVGLRTILGARRVLLMAFGAEKAEAAHAMLRGPRGPSCPASFLEGHPNLHVFLDDHAAAKLG